MLPITAIYRFAQMHLCSVHLTKLVYLYQRGVVSCRAIQCVMKACPSGWTQYVPPGQCCPVCHDPAQLMCTFKGKTYQVRLLQTTKACYLFNIIIHSLVMMQKWFNISLSFFKEGQNLLKTNSIYVSVIEL